MARPQGNLAILDQLRNAHTLAEQCESLQALKNEIVGHKQRKEAWLALGVLDHVVACLFSSNRYAAKAVARDVSPHHSPKPLSDEDRVRLQALQIMTSFANGGPAFLQPLHVAGALPAILTCLSPTANPAQVVAAALKGLIGIANAAALALDPCPLDVPTLADSVFSPPHLESFCQMLMPTPAKHVFSQSPSALASTLICRLCREERHQHALATSGVLDMLATQLASFAVAQGHVVPGAEEEAYSCQLFDLFPEPPHPDAKIGPVLEAIAAILGNSRYRAARLVNSPAVLVVFPSIKFHPAEGSIAAKKAKGKITAMEYLLPRVPIPFAHTSSRAYHSESAGKHDPEPPHRPLGDQPLMFPKPAAETVVFGARSSSSGDEIHIESPLIPWLIFQFRALSGYERLMAAAVLTCLYKAGLGRPAVREVTLGMIVVPDLVELLKKNSRDAIGSRDSSDSSDSIDATRCLIMERTPTILAHLMADSDYLQKAAYDCSVVRTLEALIKRAYEPMTASEQQPQAWSPRPAGTMPAEGEGGPPSSSRLGMVGQNPILSHRVRLRESVLRAIGTFASGKDDYRKAFAEEDLFPYLVESLTETPAKPRQIKERFKDTSPNRGSTASANARAYGKNPPSVIIAACHAVRMLARSISILRTLLVDYPVALPIFASMTHPSDLQIQTAATAAICNLVTEVSPSREVLVEAGVMRVLCNHARSNDAGLRLNALWALKHLVVAMTPELKKTCIEALEPEWLMQLISGDEPMRSGTGAAPGEDVDEEMEAPPPLEAFRWPHVTNGILRELDSSRSVKLRQVEDALVLIHEAETDPVRRARLDSIAVQEQGLDLIRNLIGPGAGTTLEAPCETTEMIDHLFSVLGQDTFFNVLTSKLHAKVLNPYYRRASGTGTGTGIGTGTGSGSGLGSGSGPGSGPGSGAATNTMVVHPHPKVIAAVIFILVHIAASTPRHRELIVSQTGLLKQLTPQASSTDKEVRVALCHLVINLTGLEGESDVHACQRRALELKKLGFHVKMEKLHEQDKDLDVRERAKTAAWQLEKAIKC